MDGPTAIKALVKVLVLPPNGLLLLALVGIGLTRRHPRAGRAVAAMPVVLLLALSTPYASSQLVRSLDRSGPLDHAAAQATGAIVILGGGIRRDAVEYGGDTLGRLTLERVRYGARVARDLGKPVLVTGGALDGAAEAQLMRSALEQEFGISVRWVEDQSRNTHDNAMLSARILAAERIDRVVLVAHSFDIPRATIEFARAGVSVVAAPTGIPHAAARLPGDFVPSLSGLQASYYACYEILALLLLRLAS